MQALIPHQNRLFFFNLPIKVKYALLVLLDLANQKSASINEMAAKHFISKADLKSICSILQKGGLIDSVNSQGSYALNCQPWQITLLDVVKVIESTVSNEFRTQPSSAKSFETYTPDKRLIHQIWAQATVAAQNTLQQHTIEDLCQKQNADQSALGNSFPSLL